MKVDAVIPQWWQCPMPFPGVWIAVPRRWMQCLTRWMYVSHKVDVLCCDGRCSAHEGGCSDPAVVAVPMHCP